jgi:hypothetical protein
MLELVRTPVSTCSPHFAVSFLICCRITRLADYTYFKRSVDSIFDIPAEAVTT